MTEDGYTCSGRTPNSQEEHLASNKEEHPGEAR